MNARDVAVMVGMQAARDELIAQCEATGNRAPLDAWRRDYGPTLDALQVQERAAAMSERDLSAGAAHVLENVRAAMDFAEGMHVSEDTRLSGANGLHCGAKPRRVPRLCRAYRAGWCGMNGPATRYARADLGAHCGQRGSAANANSLAGIREAYANATSAPHVRNGSRASVAA